jgi:hypothetical protein
VGVGWFDMNPRGGSHRRRGGVQVPEQRRHRRVTVPWPAPEIEAPIMLWDAITGEGIHAVLSYATSDPCAVWIFFDAGAREPFITWALSRDLLHTGLYTGTGTGDVRVEPAEDCQSVFLTLASPDGVVTLEADTTPVAAFLGRTARQVALGSETAAVADIIDEALEKILTP